MFDYKEDCIHLKACRRLQKRFKGMGFTGNRGCNDDCTAYVSGEKGNYVSVDEAIRYAIEGAQSVINGYGAYDVYAPQDLEGLNLSDIIEENSED